MTTHATARKFYPIYQALLDNGWQEHRTDAGRCFAKNDGNQFIVLNLREIFLTDQQKLELNWFLHSMKLFNIVQTISPNKLRDWLPLTVMSDDPREQKVSLSVSDSEDFVYSQAEEIVNELVDWGRNVDVDQTIRAIASSPIPNVGGAQLKHLAALAYVGDFNTLMDYQQVFKKGKRMNFVPMITPEMIDRAVGIALDRA